MCFQYLKELWQFLRIRKKYCPFIDYYNSYSVCRTSYLNSSFSINFIYLYDLLKRVL